MKERNRQTNRQTNKQTNQGEQTFRITGKGTDRQKRETSNQIDRQTKVYIPNINHFSAPMYGDRRSETRCLLVTGATGRSHHARHSKGQHVHGPGTNNIKLFLTLIVLDR